MAENEKKLYRSSDEVMIAGVCGGLGEYFGVDATVVRLAYVILAVLMGGIGGLVVYAVMWLLMPLAPVEAGASEDVASDAAPEDGEAAPDAGAPAEVTETDAATEAETDGDPGVEDPGDQG